MWDLDNSNIKLHNVKKSIRFINSINIIYAYIHQVAAVKCFEVLENYHKNSKSKKIDSKPFLL